MTTFEHWTHQQVQTMLTLHEAGLSCSQIGARVGKTRNAVIGKLHRMGIVKHAPSIDGAENEPRPRASRKKERLKPSLPRAGQALQLVKPAPLPAPIVAPIAIHREGQPVTVLTIKDGMCKFPIGDPKHADFHFCGNAQRGDGAPYCAYHCGVAYVTGETGRKPGQFRLEGRKAAMA